MRTEFKPYLGLPARLSQVWLNRWTLLFSLIFVQLLSTAIGLKSDLANAKTEALSACLSLEKTGSLLASIPHYMASGMNAMTAKGIEGGISALSTTTTLMLTGVEEVVLFMINTYKNTYLCLFTFAVRGSLGAVIGAAEDTVTFLNSTLGTIEQNIESDAAAAQNAILSAVEGILGGIGSVFGASPPNLPSVTIPSASRLSNIQIPDTINNALASLNSSLPTFEEVRNASDTAISFPFELLKSSVRSTFDNFTFNHSLLPVPAAENLQFCSNSTQLNDFFQSLNDSVHKILIILSVITLLAALLSVIPYAILEWWAWRKLKKQARTGEEALRSMAKPDYIELAFAIASPIGYKLGNLFSSKASSRKNKVMFRWFFAYITHPPALLVLAISLAIFLSCIFQTILLNEVRKAAPVLVADVGDAEALISAKIQNATAFWVNGTNNQINNTESDINDNLLGWARQSTLSLNNTLNTFVDTTVTTVQKVFGGTPLQQPVLDVLDCILLMKIEGIQKALTFINENAKVEFPRVDNSTLNIDSKSAGPDQGSLQAAIQDASSSLLDIINRVVDKWQAAVRQQVIVGGIFMAIYGIVVLMGIVGVIHGLRQGKLRGEGAGIARLPAQGIAWARSRFRTDNDNPFEDSKFEQQPGPTPVSRPKA